MDFSFICVKFAGTKLLKCNYEASNDPFIAVNDDHNGHSQQVDDRQRQ